MKLTIYLLLSILGSLTWANPLRIEGIAKDLKTGQVVYTEIHTLTQDSNKQNTKVETKYYAPNKELFAELSSDFTNNKFIPNVTFSDFRNKKKFTKIISQPKELTIESEIHGQKNQKIVKINSELTISGQGFDNFLKAHFNINEPLKVDFLVLEKKKIYGFLIEKTEPTATTTKFSLALDSFLKYFAMPIEVIYDTKTMFLKKYKGLSNITDHEDKTLIVEIDYSLINDK